MTEQVATLEEAYKEDRRTFLDPESIGGSLLDRLPTPTGWRILILPYRGQGKTEGGILLADKTLE